MALSPGNARYKPIVDCITEIQDAVHNRLLESKLEGNILEDVEAVIKGDRARPMPRNPSLWVILDAATIDTTTSGLGEDWVVPVILAALITSDEPEEAYVQATEIAANAMNVVVGRDRRLGLGFVRDIKPVSLDPGSAKNSDDEKNLYWADATVNVHFRRIEP